MYKELEAWKESHDGKIPNNFSEKNEFREQIKSCSRFAYNESENVQEAYNKIGNAFKPIGEVPDELTEIFGKLENFENSKNSFWVLVKAL